MSSNETLGNNNSTQDEESKSSDNDNAENEIANDASGNTSDQTHAGVPDIDRPSEPRDS